MSNKTIAIPEALYNRLKALKKPKESFSELLSRMVDSQCEQEKRDISWFFGILADDSDEWDEIEQKLYDSRANDLNREWISFND
ncbi:MAG TPA: antitoxin VapB family protein [Candidatus Lokiarchaeia archaeon]|nr:antitoxin VapB family protein [Candidatus Lokiarchaeia archaeon]